MNIIIAIEYFLPFGPGGAERSAHRLAQILAARGHKVRVVTPDLGGAIPEDDYPDDVVLTKSGDAKIIRFPFRKTMPMPPRVFPSYVYGNETFHKLFAGQIASEAKKLDADLIVAQGLDAIAPAFIASRTIDVPAIATIRDYRALCPMSICLHHDDLSPVKCKYGDFIKCVRLYNDDYNYHPGPFGLTKNYARRTLEWFNSRRIQRALVQMDGGVFVSEGIRKIYANAKLLPKSSVAVYNLAPDKNPDVDSSLAIEKFQLQGKRLLLYVGRFSIGKGAKTLSEAVPIIREKAPDCVVVVAGAREFIVPETDGLIFAGTVDRPMLHSLYSVAKGVVLPSRWPEPFSRVLLEAARFKVPVVATKAGGNPEAITHGENGFIVERENPEEYANACLALLDLDEVSLAKMRTAMGKLLEEKLAKDVQVEKLESYFDLIAKRGRLQ